MRPVFSVIAFTVLSGAGYGMFCISAILSILNLDSGWPMAMRIAIAALAFALITCGLFCSMFHLANPVNAWRSLSRIRTSWLSREALFALAFYPLSALWVYQWLYAEPMLVLSIAVVLLALVTVYSTGMIYACLRTIRAWNTEQTPGNYILLALASGSFIVYAFCAMSGIHAPVLTALVLAFTGVAAFAKLAYYTWLAKIPKTKSSTAFALGTGEVKLIDTGHSAGNFLTREFGYRIGLSRALLLKATVILLVFIIPVAAVVFKVAALTSVFIALAMMGGLLIERWLFFAEAEHCVNTYYK